MGVGRDVAHRAPSRASATMRATTASQVELGAVDHDGVGRTHGLGGVALVALGRARAPRPRCRARRRGGARAPRARRRARPSARPRARPRRRCRGPRPRRRPGQERALRARAGPRARAGGSPPARRAARPRGCAARGRRSSSAARPASAASACACRRCPRRRAGGQRHGAVHGAGVEVAVAEPVGHRARDRRLAGAGGPVDGDHHGAPPAVELGREAGVRDADGAIGAVDPHALRARRAPRSRRASRCDGRRAASTRPPRGRAGTPWISQPSRSRARGRRWRAAARRPSRGGSTP